MFRPPSSPLALRLCVAASFVFGLAWAKEPAPAPPAVQIVGKQAPGHYLTPANQLLTPAGTQVELPGLRPQAIALSPDGKLLVTSGKTPELIVLDPKTGKIAQRVPFPGKEAAATPAPADAAGTQVKPDTGAQLSFTGLVFSPNGSRIYLANVNGDVKVFSVEKGVVAPHATFPLPEAKAPKRKPEIPAGLAVSRDGKQLFVAMNLSNRLAILDAADGKVQKLVDVGVAPFDVVLAEGKAFVSNWGGRRPGAKDLVGPAGRGTTVRVDPVRHIASEGSVSVVDLKTGKVTAEILVGLQASALAVSPDEKFVVVANSGSDTLNVIDTKTDAIVEKIWTREPSDLFTATPNALTFDKSGKFLMVCNATQNAVAVIQFDAADKESKLLGSVPVGWFPGAIVHDPARKQICVANIKGTGSTKLLKPTDKRKFNSKDYFGTISLVPVPSEKELAAHSLVVAANIRRPLIEAAKLPARPDVAAKPVPERVGEPSVFKHVIYVIKENRTYDQILGDVKSGNGDASLCLFGEKVTPNQHKIAREFVLLDNTYCSGIQSADGHQWTDSAITTDYVERGHAGWPRSYPNLKTEDALDALAYSSSGFIWDLAVKHKVSIRNYGEACVSEANWKDATGKKTKPTWSDYYSDYLGKTALTKLACKPGIESLRKISKLDTVGWDMNVPDVMRVAEFAKELAQFEKTGSMPQLIILFLPNDHTGGTRPGGPSPAAQVADNDLAMGKLVELVSHSAFWKDTCIFAIEDDPQNGADHISGYRTTCYVASAYTKRGNTISTPFNQTGVVRTMELILGLPPMNIMDASATPMSDCFTDTPDLTPFKSVPAQTPLDQLNPAPAKIGDRQLRKDAIASAKLPLSEPDRCDEDQLNRILWRAVKGPRVPYPEWAVTKVDDDD